LLRVGLAIVPGKGTAFAFDEGSYLRELVSLSGTFFIADSWFGTRERKSKKKIRKRGEKKERSKKGGTKKK
jgi:hypothetical protein